MKPDSERKGKSWNSSRQIKRNDIQRLVGGRGLRKGEELEVSVQKIEVNGSIESIHRYIKVFR